MTNVHIANSANAGSVITSTLSIFRLCLTSSLFRSIHFSSAAAEASGSTPLFYYFPVSQNRILPEPCVLGISAYDMPNRYISEVPNELKQCYSCCFRSRPIYAVSFLFLFNSNNDPYIFTASQSIFRSLSSGRACFGLATTANGTPSRTKGKRRRF